MPDRGPRLSLRDGAMRTAWEFCRLTLLAVVIVGLLSYVLYVLSRPTEISQGPLRFWYLTSGIMGGLYLLRVRSDNSKLDDKFRTILQQYKATTTLTALVVAAVSFIPTLIFSVPELTGSLELSISSFFQTTVYWYVALGVILTLAILTAVILFIRSLERYGASEPTLYVTASITAVLLFGFVSFLLLLLFGLSWKLLLILVVFLIVVGALGMFIQVMPGPITHLRATEESILATIGIYVFLYANFMYVILVFIEYHFGALLSR